MHNLGTRGRIARAATVLLVSAACGTGARPAPTEPEPLPRSMPTSYIWREIQVCALEAETLRQVPVLFNVASGDTAIGGRPFSSVYPTTDQFAATARWFHDNELVALEGRRYIKYGTSRAMRPGDLVSAGRTYQGVPLFTEPSDPFPSAVIYVPVRPECVFQTYQWDLVVEGVRG